MTKKSQLASEKSSFEHSLKSLNHHSDGHESWNRPEAPLLDPIATPLQFLQIEIDNYMGPVHPLVKQHNEQTNNGQSSISTMPIIRLFGVTWNQHSVLCHVHGFMPYLYILAPKGFQFNNDSGYNPHLSAFRAALESKLRSEHPKELGQMISRITIEMKESIYGFSGNNPSPFLCIMTTSPTFLNTVKRILESGSLSFASFQPQVYVTYESNMPFVLRFMVDAKITGMNWIELPKGKYLIRNSQENRPPNIPIHEEADFVSKCQYEVDIFYSDIISYAPEDPWLLIPPLRILSFDIECSGRKGVFPEASIDPVIQIANMVILHGQTTPIIRNVFTLKSCGHITGAHVYSFDNESDLLNAWSQFFNTVDPDVITGYNILNFDFPYLLDRAEHLKLEHFPYLGRIAGSHTKAKDTLFSSKAYGTRESKVFNTEGRLIFDLIQVVQRDYKLRSYTLNAVSAHFLGEQKEDVHHSIISDLQNGNEETRRRLAIYCLKDAYLPIKLLEKLMCLVNYIEMSRVTGVPFNYILQRGQQIKVVSQLYRRASDSNLVIPAVKTEATEEQYEGATVIEPVKGYYDVPVATLDFASLYPSIMMAYNLCYTTLLDPKDLTKWDLTPDDYIKTPSGDYFVKKHIRKGILPLVLEDLLSTRKRAKADLKKETDLFKKAVLDGRQLALKISANSVYGFTGATIGKLPCIQISQSVTAFGRQMIQQTQELVEQHYTTSNQYASNAKVIYGDTDSVMVNFGLPDLVSVMKLGKEAAEVVSKNFPSPIHLEFEKCYFPYLLINKKRYAGLYWTNPNKYDKMDTKGIETVRRDNCRLVQTLITTCLHKILIDRDLEGAKAYAKQTISDLLQNKIDMSQLVITKALSKSGEEYAGKQAHVELAEKMRKRDPGSAPGLGDRVAYVIVKGLKGTAAYEKAEDPIYVLENNLPLDTTYYLENQLSKPLMRIFEPIIKNPEELLSGEHTRTVHVSAPSLGALRKFVIRTESCLGCKSPLSAAKGERAVCQYCKENTDVIYYKQLELHNEMELKFSRLWTQCQRCQESMHQDVLCTSKDCPIFYMRKKAQKDMKDAADTLERFNYEW